MSSDPVQDALDNAPIDDEPDDLVSWRPPGSCDGCGTMPDQGDDPECDVRCTTCGKLALYSLEACKRSLELTDEEIAYGKKLASEL